jgi:hypothetical protein
MKKKIPKYIIAGVSICIAFFILESSTTFHAPHPNDPSDCFFRSHKFSEKAFQAREQSNYAAYIYNNLKAYRGFGYVEKKHPGFQPMAVNSRKQKALDEIKPF